MALAYNGLPKHTFTTDSSFRIRKMGLEYTRIARRPSMLVTGKLVRKYRVNLRRTISNNRMGKWMLMRTMERGTSIYDIII